MAKIIGFECSKCGATFMAETGPKRLRKRWRPAVRPLRSGGDSAEDDSRVGQCWTEKHVALCGGPSRCRAGDAWRGTHADAAKSQVSQSADQGRGVESDGLVQSAWHERGTDHGASLWTHQARRAFGRQRRRIAGRLCRRSRTGGVRLHAEGCADRESFGGGSKWRAPDAGGWAYQRLRANGCRAQGPGRLVRCLNPEGTVSGGRQEDDGLRSGRANGMEFTGRRPVPDGRRSRAHRHVEGV